MNLKGASDKYSIYLFISNSIEYFKSSKIFSWFCRCGFSVWGILWTASSLVWPQTDFFLLPQSSQRTNVTSPSDHGHWIWLTPSLDSLSWAVSTCEILARYHAPGAGWYWNLHTAAINIPIYFLTYIFSHYFKKHIEIFFKNSWQQRDSNHRPIDHEPSRLTSTPARVLCRNIAFYPAWTFTE